MSPIDAAYARVRGGSHPGFAEWVRHVEPAVRATLRGFARHVDVEAVVQEALLRMWKLAPTLDLQGEDASLRYAARIARNLALQESRRLGRQVALESDEGGEIEIPVPPSPVPDRGLREAILACLRKLPSQPAAALRARLADAGERADRDLAASLHMTLNTFLQNVVRARRHLAECLKSHGVAVEEWIR